jgi:hypothetical protein
MLGVGTGHKGLGPKSYEGKARTNGEPRIEGFGPQLFGYCYPHSKEG